MIKRPTLLLDEKKCLANIRFMAEKARKCEVEFRPHFKTHVSHEIGRWFRKFGVDKISTSSLEMADYFAKDGWKNITVAFPVNILEIDLINHLASKIQLNAVVESLETAHFLMDNLLAQLHYYIKVDPGYGRTGIAWDNEKLIKELIEVSENSDALNFYGFLAHAGHSYSARSKEQILEVHTTYLQKMNGVKKLFLHQYPELVLSVGDTPTCSVANDFGLADEIRPGNFVFYDVTQTIIGSCTQDQIATAMACPVVAIHKNKNKLIIHGGSIHFSTDSIEDENGNIIFGKVVENIGDGWGKIIEGAYVSKLSQEHGTVIIPDNTIDNYHIGSIIKILPIHSCTNSNLMKLYHSLDGRLIERL